MFCRIFALFVLGSVAVAPAAAQAAAAPSRRTPIVEVFERCRDAVVNISTSRVVQMRTLGGPSRWDDIFDFGEPRIRNQRVQSIGSGAIIHSSGIVITNAHVVAQASDVNVTFANKDSSPARIIAVDPQHDLAVLKIDAPQPLPHLRLGRSDDILVGETVVVIGNPLGLQHTVTAGIVSALDRELRFSEETVYTGLIQTDAPINKGNSGGPLLNINGELIGINSAIRGDAQNIGFAIPVDRLWELLPSMLDIERRERVRFGLTVSGRDAEVTAVRANSPAARSGVRVGDRVVGLNGTVLHDAIDYYVHLLEQKPGAKVDLRVQRGEQVLTEAVELQVIPPPDGRRLAAALLGMELGEVPERRRREFDLPANVGLLIERVERGSPAERAGLQAGDVLLRLGRVTVPTTAEVGLALESVSGGERVLLEGLRLDAEPPFFWSVPLRARAR